MLMHKMRSKNRPPRPNPVPPPLFSEKDAVMRNHCTLMGYPPHCPSVMGPMPKEGGGPEGFYWSGWASVQRNRTSFDGCVSVYFEDSDRERIHISSSRSHAVVFKVDLHSPTEEQLIQFLDEAIRKAEEDDRG